MRGRPGLYLRWYCDLTYHAFCNSVRESPDATDRILTIRLQIAVEREFAILVDLLLGGGDQLVALLVLVVDPLPASKDRIVAHRCTLQRVRKLLQGTASDCQRGDCFQMDPLTSVGFTAAALLPMLARGSLRKMLTKPF